MRKPVVVVTALILILGLGLALTLRFVLQDAINPTTPAASPGDTAAPASTSAGKPGGWTLWFKEDATGDDAAASSSNAATNPNETPEERRERMRQRQEERMSPAMQARQQAAEERRSQRQERRQSAGIVTVPAREPIVDDEPAEEEEEPVDVYAACEELEDEAEATCIENIDDRIGQLRDLCDEIDDVDPWAECLEKADRMEPYSG
jgi:hypothetical protein